MKISNHISRFGLLLDDESSLRPTLPAVKPDSRLVTNNVTRPNFVLSVLTNYNESCESLTKSLHNCERLGITKLWIVSKSQHRVTKNTSWTVAISHSTFIAFIDATYVEWQAFRVDSPLPVTSYRVVHLLRATRLVWECCGDSMHSHGAPLLLLSRPWSEAFPRDRLTSRPR